MQEKKNDKDKVLKAWAIGDINKEMNLCTDADLLDLIYDLLHKARMQKEANQTEEAEEI